MATMYSTTLQVYGVSESSWGSWQTHCKEWQWSESGLGLPLCNCSIPSWYAQCGAFCDNSMKFPTEINTH